MKSKGKSKKHNITELSKSPQQNAGSKKAAKKSSKAEDLRIKDAVLSSSINGIGIADLDGNITYVNSSWLRIWGYDDENEVLGKPVIRFFTDEEEVEKIIEKLHKEDGWAGELVGKKKDGSTVHLQVFAAIVKDKLGQPLCTTASFVEITKRKQAEKWQKLATQVLEMLNHWGKETDIIRDILALIKDFSGFEAVGIRLRKDEDFPYYKTIGFPPYFIEAERYLCARDQEGEIIRDSKGNPCLECMCGNILCGRTNPALPFFTEGGSFWINSTSVLLASTTEEDRQTRTRNRCNGEGYESVALIPLRSDNETIGLLQLNDSRRDMFSMEMIRFLEGIGSSIGIALRRIQTEEALQRAHDELEHRVRERTAELAVTNRMLEQEIEEHKRDVDLKTRLEHQVRQMQKMEALGTLAGGIAHDLNNILMPIIINTELAVMGVSKKSRAGQYLEQVLEAANRGKELVNQIVTFSHQKEIERKRMKISPLIKESLKFLRSTLPTTIDIRVNIEADNGMALVNPTQIHQVLINLCSNAAYAMRDKGGVLSVSLAEVEVDSDTATWIPDLKPGAYLKLTISDTGHGMDKAVMERIFEPFFTTKEPGMGTGMGLAVVHGIIKSHDGAIGVFSEPRKGATFDVFLPMMKGSFREETALSTPITRGSERILLVDDDKSLTQSVKHMLKNLGYKVTGKTSSRLALKAFRAQPGRFDLVITDMIMPNMTGTDLSKELIRIRPDIPIILCIGINEKIPRSRAEELGIREFLIKPVNTRNVAKAIRRVLKKS